MANRARDDISMNTPQSGRGMFTHHVTLSVKNLHKTFLAFYSDEFALDIKGDASDTAEL